MSGCFFAFTGKTAARNALPECFAKDDAGVWQVSGGAMLRSTKGVWLVDPVMSDPDPETGEQTVITEGERSKPYVLLLPEDPGKAQSACIVPAGDQGFA